MCNKPENKRLQTWRGLKIAGGGGETSKMNAEREEPKQEEERKRRREMARSGARSKWHRAAVHRTRQQIALAGR